MDNQKRIRKRFVFVLAAFFALATFLWLTVSYYQNTNLRFIPTKYAAGETIPFIPLFEVTDQLNTIKSEKEAVVKKKIFDEKVVKAEAILKRYNSPMQGLGNIIVQKADECGGDYKILLAIAGNESRFGAVPVKKYNPYGYLDGVQYSSFQHALEVISCAISKRFIARCSGDITCIVKTYAGPSDDKERWVYNINWFINQI